MRHLTLACCLSIALAASAWAGELALPLAGRLRKPVRSLQEIREARVIKQRWDNSCGSAALSTLLTHYYGDKVSEALIIMSMLKRTDPQKVRARGGFSLLDLKRFVESRGYRGEGYSGLTLEELAQTGVPSIVPIRIKNFDHFVLFRGVLGGRVVLADPSSGTMTMKNEQFLEIWKNGTGFVVRRADAPVARERLAPKEEDFFLPPLPALTRSLLRTGTLPLTRNGI